MTEEKQIEEMLGIQCVFYGECEKCPVYGSGSYALERKCTVTCRRLYEAGYRKQRGGEWEQQLRPYEDEIKCTACGALFNVIDNCTEKFNYCPNCGAKMKGE